MDETTCNRAILIVEDSPTDTQLIELAVTDARVSVEMHFASDGVKALSFLRGEAGFQNAPRPRLVLLDLKLPRKGGVEVLREMRADERLKTIPVVVFSSSDDYGDIESSCRVGANAYTSKPTDPLKFSKTVTQTVEYWFGCTEPATCCQDGMGNS